MYGRKNRIKYRGRCENCGKVTTFDNYDGRKWGHLYFIPLIPGGGKVRVMRECQSCNVGVHIPIEHVPQIVESTKQKLDQIIASIGSGESWIKTEANRVSASILIGGIVLDIFCLKGEEELLLLIDNLRAVGAQKELLLVEAKLHEFKGNNQKADSTYKEIENLDDNWDALYFYAKYLYDTNRPGKAVVIAEKIELSYVEDLSLKQLLIDCYEGTKQWSKVAATYENCFLIVPELKNQKEVYKRYKKACKKGGVKPQ